MKIKLVIFDLGEVVFHYSFENAFSYWSLKSGISCTDLKNGFSVDESYLRHEIGEIDIAEYKKNVCAKLGMDITIEDFVIGWNSIFLQEIPGVKTLIEDLKKNHTVVALSNTNQTHCDFINKKYKRLLSAFDRIYYSHEIHERKPDRKAYEKVIKQHVIENREALMIDDLPANISGAKEIGMNAILVTDYAAMVSGLKEMGMIQ